ncbi:Hypothetical protein RADP37_04207a [Roseomonas mucosa]|uniref:Uncharacterized protein n=1 Tax=Roseomonas mucosa TaxID=207340 RepID=A0A4Y1MU53_9PROT|nr:Hypothetical protein RADP37_04207a [Roseomonas mucosa]
MPVVRTAVRSGRCAPWPAPGGEAPPLPPDPLSAGDRSRSPDPGLSWVPVVVVSLRPNPWEQVATRGSRKEDKAPCPRWWHWQSAGERCSPARSGRQRRGNEREVQEPQVPGG